ncbi:S8 family serine peptidase [Tuwongella immobilis]|uniref:Peptidase S8/S53 domain-containing protein n=1 Tax=Tuwongella immobilis TaxID=692036 RepID=A0A6C2YP50_9BACT
MRGWIIGLALIPLGSWFLVAPSRAQQSTPKHRNHDIPEWIDRLNVPDWHAKRFTGQGIRVAVLDSSFRGYRQHLGRELPQTVVTQSFRRDGNLEPTSSPHGLLCAELIHRIAPDAEILLANWEPNQPDRFLAAVQWAVAQQASIISCSVVMPAWSDGQGGGAIHQQLQRLLRSEDPTNSVWMVASIGNLAERHWHGELQPNADGCHHWNPDQLDSINDFYPWNAGPVGVECVALSQSNAQSLPEFEVIDSTTSQPVAVERFAIPARDLPGLSIRWRAQSDHEYGIRAMVPAHRHASPLKPVRFRLVALGGELEHHHPRGSLAFPGDHPRVIAVGAVDSSGERVPYSGIGTSRDHKPELVAVVPVPLSARLEPFGGTSAAAPQIAGLAALWRAAVPAGRQADFVRSCRDAHASFPSRSPARLPDPARLSSFATGLSQIQTRADFLPEFFFRPFSGDGRPLFGDGVERGLSR